MVRSQLPPGPDHEVDPAGDLLAAGAGEAGAAHPGHLLHVQHGAQLRGAQCETLGPGRGLGTPRHVLLGEGEEGGGAEHEAAPLLLLQECEGVLVQVPEGDGVQAAARPHPVRRHLVNTPPALRTRHHHWTSHFYTFS